MRNRSYASTILIIVVVGMVLYSVLYVLPQFLSLIAGYNAEQSGRVVLAHLGHTRLPDDALPAAHPGESSPLQVDRDAGGELFRNQLLSQHRRDRRHTGGEHFVATQLLQGFGQILCFMPLNQASVGSVSREDAADAAASLQHGPKPRRVARPGLDRRFHRPAD